MLVEAPGRFSMMTGWPRRRLSHGSTMRATMSAPPPGGKPITQRSGFDGQACVEACAHAARGSVGSARLEAASCRNRRRRSGIGSVMASSEVGHDVAERALIAPRDAVRIFKVLRPRALLPPQHMRGGLRHALRGGAGSSLSHGGVGAKGPIKARLESTVSPALDRNRIERRKFL